MAAPKGNKNAIGNKGGCPPIYDNADELQKKIDEYFVLIEGVRHEKESDDDLITWDIMPEDATITGLAYHLGFESRSTIYEYEKKIEFSYIIKRAMLRVEKEYEMRLHGNNCTGAIFALKNMDWHDKTETQHSGEIKGSSAIIVTSDKAIAATQKVINDND